MKSNSKARAFHPYVSFFGDAFDPAIEFRSCDFPLAGIENFFERLCAFPPNVP